MHEVRELISVDYEEEEAVEVRSYSKLTKTGQFTGHSSCFFIALQLAETASQCLALANAASCELSLAS